jgi:hypothetical protein
MRRAVSTVLLLLSIGGQLVARAGRADVVPPLVGSDRPAARTWLDASWDPTFVVGSGLSTRVVHVRPGAAVDLDAAIAAPVLLVPDGRAWRVVSGLTGSFTHASGYGLAIGVHPDLRSTSDSVANMIGLGMTVAARPGYYGRRWTVALDLAWSAALLTRISPRAPVYDLFGERYPEQTDTAPSARFYSFTSQRLRAGVAGGVALKRWLSAHGELGFAYTPQLTGLVNPPYGPLPFYTALGGAYRW